MVYLPAEDSFLLSSYIEKNFIQILTKSLAEKSYFNILDLGSGNFYQTKTLLKTIYNNKEILKKINFHETKEVHVFLSDIDKEVFFLNESKERIKTLKEYNYKINITLLELGVPLYIKLFFINTNLLKIYKRKFDLILFNPPYLPFDKREGFNYDTTGGFRGYEVSLRFLNELLNVLELKGQSLMITSNFTKNHVDKELSKLTWSYKILDTLNLYPFESLFLYRIEWLLKNKNFAEFLKNPKFRIYYFNKGKKSIILKNNLYPNYLIKLSDEKTVSKEYKMLKIIKEKIPEKLLFIPNFFIERNILFLEEIKGFSYNQINKIWTKYCKDNKYQDFLINKEKLYKNINILKKVTLKMLKESLFYSFLLDSIKLNKNEMNHPEKHIIFSLKHKKTFFIDFERANLTNSYKKSKNLSQILNFITKELGLKFNLKFDEQIIRKLIKEYKNSEDRKKLYENYKKLKYFLFNKLN